MPRTKLQREYLKRIDAINNQLWYFIFISEELNFKLSNYTDKAKNVYTTDLFKNNPYSKKINVKVNTLSTHQGVNKTFTFGSYFATCYETVSNYIEDIFDHLKITNSLPAYQWNRNKEPEFNLKNLFDKNRLGSLPAYIINTLTYLRLRRNHFTHLIDNPSKKLIDFVAREGVNLNTQWKKSKILSIDFSKSATVDFGQDQTIELIKVLRICLIELDHHISSLLNLKELIKLLVEKELRIKTNRVDPVARTKRIKKIISIAKNDLGRTLTEAQITPFLK